MDIVKNKTDCCGCYACSNICPVNAIDMCSDEEGFWYPVILQDKCINCRQCEKVCPTYNRPDSFSAKSSFGCYANKSEELMSSSSGGVFSVIARKIISCGGIVCGAAFNEEMEVVYTIIDSEQDLIRLKGTKYVQSRIGTVYSEIEQLLKTGKQVLFSGTPCQVAGLKSFLKKDYENLFCIDLICHGVPSPEVWRRYLCEISNDKKVKNVVFRNKSKGISNITLDYTLENGEVIQEKYSDSLYIKGFIQNLYLRPSCFECKFKGIDRCSDMTIGDFWAMKEYHPSEYQENGVSAVIIHSDKAEKLFAKISVDMKVVKSSIEEIGCWNECLFSSVQPNLKRTKFFSLLKDLSVLESIKQCIVVDSEQKKETNSGFILKIKSKITNLLK